MGQDNRGSNRRRVPGGIGHLRNSLVRGKDSGICESIFVQFSHKILNTSWFKGNKAYQVLKWHSHILNSYFVEKSTQNSCSMFVALLNIKTNREPQQSFCWGKKYFKVSLSIQHRGLRNALLFNRLNALITYLHNFLLGAFWIQCGIPVPSAHLSNSDLIDRKKKSMIPCQYSGHQGWSQGTASWHHLPA